MRKGEFNQAREILRQLHKAAPDRPIYTLVSAELASAAGDTQSAVELFSELYASDKTHPAYIEGYTQALINRGEHASAIRMLRKTIRHHPEYGWAYTSLGRAYAADGQTLNAAFIEAQQLKNIGLYDRALALLRQQTLRAHPDSSEYLTASINSLIKQLEEEKRQMENFKL